MSEEEKKAAVEIDKYFWMITEAKYDQLRTISGCEELTDLNATITDGEHIIELANQFGIPEDNRFIDISPTMTDLKKTYMKILKISRANSGAGKPHVIFVYIGGHGATQSEKQIYLLNSETPNGAMFQIEYKLRYITSDALSTARIFGVFDCCRVPLKNMPGLTSGRGVGGQDEEGDETEDDAPNKYFHLQACGPGGIADADGGFAKKILTVCAKYATKNPKGFMYWPTDFTKFKWAPGEISLSGGEPYLIPFGQQGAMEAQETIQTTQGQEESKEPSGKTIPD